MTKEDASQILADAKAMRSALEAEMTENLKESLTNTVVRNTVTKQLQEMEDFDNEGEMEEDLDEIFDLSSITEEEDPMETPEEEGGAEGDMSLGDGEEEGGEETPEHEAGEGNISDAFKQEIIDAVMSAIKQSVGSPADTTDSTELPQEETPLDEADEAILEGILAEIDGTPDSKDAQIAQLQESVKILKATLNEALKDVVASNAIKSLMKESNLSNAQLTAIAQKFDGMKDATAIKNAHQVLKEALVTKPIVAKAKSTQINEAKSVKSMNSNKAPKQVALNESVDPFLQRMKGVLNHINQY